MTYSKKTVMLCSFILIGTAAAQMPSRFVSLNAGINTAYAPGYPDYSTGLRPFGEFNAAAIGYSFLVNYYAFDPKNKNVGLKVSAGFFTVKFRDDYFASKILFSSGSDITIDVDSKYRLNHVLTVGPAFVLNTNLGYFLFEPGIGIIGGLDPNYRVTINRTFNNSRDVLFSDYDYNSEKVKIGYQIGISWFREITDDMLAGISTAYFSGGTEYSFIYKTHSRTRSSYTGKVQNKSGLMINVSIGWRLPE